MRSHVRDNITPHASRAEGRFVKLPILSYRFWKEGLLVHYLLVKWSCYDHLYVLEPYLWPATNGSVLNFSPPGCPHTSDLLSTFCLPSVYLWHCARDFTYKALPFFVCNIKNWEWPGDEATPIPTKQKAEPQGLVGLKFLLSHGNSPYPPKCLMDIWYG